MNNNFNDKKESLISLKKWKRQQFKRRNLRWVYVIPNCSQQNDFKDYKCSKMRLLQYIAPKRADFKRLQL